MIAALKAELRKLRTVRSTYYIFGFTFLITGLFLGFWAYGYKNAGSANVDHGMYLTDLYATVTIAGILLSIIAILLVGHEYRYNTIMYSLTATNRRFKVFLAKWIALLVFSVAFAAVIAGLNFLMLRLGLALHGAHIVAQQVPVVGFLWRSLLTVWVSVTYAFIIAMLVRNLIGAIVVVLVVPSTIENLLVLLLHGNVKYLPYTALGNLTDTTTKVATSTSLLVVSEYVVVGLLVSYLLFRRRDAN